MATIEITGPNQDGTYTVESESDQMETQETQQGAPEGAAEVAGESAEGEQGGNTITCTSIREVLQAVKGILQGQGGGASGQDMWNQEAAKSASQKQQMQAY